MDRLVRRAAMNCAGAYREWAARTGHPTALWADLSVGDLGVGGGVPVDSASLLQPVETRSGLDDAVDRAEALFARREGGPVQLWSVWPTPDLSDRGYSLHHVPGMIRPAGGTAPRVPAELEVTRASTPADLQDSGRLIDAVFECHAPRPQELLSPALVGEDWATFVGRVDGVVVATATAFVSDGFCGVYAVATAPEVRGRGYGEALSWAATLFRADLPATLQASDMGLPVYRRMGYEVFGQFSLWEGPRPRAGSVGLRAG